MLSGAKPALFSLVQKASMSAGPSRSIRVVPNRGRMSAAMAER
jgi:hypothetical protein